MCITIRLVDILQLVRIGIDGILLVCWGYIIVWYMSHEHLPKGKQ
jgi:hypothetical protein